MLEVAAAAGIARGTLYRYFPNRESLLRALEAAANEEAGRRLAEANLDQIPVEEALARGTRALVAVGEHAIRLLDELSSGERPRWTPVDAAWTLNPAPPPTETTEASAEQAKTRSPLTDSHRRPPPYHRAP
jgi:AcrR family transcriptional regulator